MDWARHLQRIFCSTLIFHRNVTDPVIISWEFTISKLVEWTRNFISLGYCFQSRNKSSAIINAGDFRIVGSCQNFNSVFMTGGIWISIFEFHSNTLWISHGSVSQWFEEHHPIPFHPNSRTWRLTLHPWNKRNWGWWKMVRVRIGWI